MTTKERTHLRVAVHYTACGVVGRCAQNATEDTDQVTCGNCEKTQAFASFAQAQEEAMLEDFYDAD